MSTSNAKKQKLIIQDLLTLPEIYSRVASILKADYFDPEYIPVVSFIHDYYTKYNSTPAFDTLEAEFDVELVPSEKVTKDRIDATCDSVERFCRESAAKDAVFKSIELIENDDLSSVVELIQSAASVVLQKDLGVDIYEEPEERLKSLVEKFTPIPSLIGGLDEPLGGGFVRKQFTLFSANSGGGKSIMMQNLGHNFSTQGHHVLNISLELEEDMIFLRLGSIISGVGTANWQAKIPEISAGLMNSKSNLNGGSYLIKRMPVGATALDIRTYLKFYELEYGRTPDILIIDYLDLMHPNGGVKNQGIFEQDKSKAEEVREILFDYNMIGISASQQNREALNMSSPSQSGIAGGLSKVNTVDNYISLFMDETMALEGVMNAFFLKCRSSHGTGHCSVLSYNKANLKIGDKGGGGSTITVMPTGRKKKKEEDDKIIGEVTAEITGMPGVEDDVTTDDDTLFPFSTDETAEEPTVETAEITSAVVNDVTLTEVDKLIDFANNIGQT